MLFTSFTFLVFVLITFILYYLPIFKGIQVPILVTASFIFYAWSSPALLLLLIISIGINVLTSFKICHTDKRQVRILWAVLGVAANLGVLGLFKYGALLTNLFTTFLNINPTPEDALIQTLLHLPLPIGISFYTFQGISLVVDVLRQQDAEWEVRKQQEKYFVHLTPIRYLLNTSFFLSFFPQLVAGPIVRANDFYPQIARKYFQDIPWELVFRALVSGYFLKMVIADNIKDYTFWITYPYYQSQGTLTNLVLLFGYSMQIFADFAGYSLIAIGLAASFGYTLPENFNFPYISRSIAEFWRRWHISLSTWLKYYLYIPLGGNRKGEIRTYLNLMIVMTLGGLWHGAAWSYAVWGMFHGMGLAVERLLGWDRVSQSSDRDRIQWKPFLTDTIRVLAVFTFVSFGWLLFKLPEFSQAVDFMVTLARNTQVKPALIRIIPVLLFSLPVLLYHLPHFPNLQSKGAELLGSGTGKKLQVLSFGLMLALIILNKGSSNAFIYFQF
ncbi:MBOAT family protein [Roseofilum sp. BLCC_M154]|uniref:MBOAT family protein n=1 Tax=Roseofilum acuticapitatum BLCC-M154 TaxID=3022444 RepID=A0ABT7AT41_9CYAN|nr:MBOAT family O-acyltransferase [Roseofilum acuticapitatum]MDJ1169594.1 MBOAT family protein [Roseofilum acuticapitatum BLCC-M154]